MMSNYDVAEAGLIDNTGFDGNEDAQVDGSALDLALFRISAPEEEGRHYGFNSII
jgi:hypothetical protein